jgi:predicted methyltransferase
VKKLTLTVVLFLGFLPAYAQMTETQEKLKAAMESDIRTDAEVARDRNRKPIETMSFFQFRDDMRVLELIPGGGWYAKLLVPTLRDKGEYYAAIGTSRIVENLSSLDGFDRMKVLEIGVESTRTGPFRSSEMPPFSFGVEDLDLVVTFRNMHNFSPKGRAAINDATFAALKSGGLYGVIDHTRRHMQALNNELRRRADPVEIIKEAQDAGFVLEGFSDLHYRPDDALLYEVGRKTVTGNTDRFTLLFRKP